MPDQIDLTPNTNSSAEEMRLFISDSTVYTNIQHSITNKTNKRKNKGKKNCQQNNLHKKTQRGPR